MNIKYCQSMTIGEVNELIHQLDEAIRSRAEKAMLDHGVEDFSESQSLIDDELSSFMSIKEALIVYNKWAVCNTDEFTASTDKVKEQFYIMDRFTVGVKVSIECDTDNRSGIVYNGYKKPTHYISEITDAVCTFKRIKRQNEID